LDGSSFCSECLPGAYSTSSALSFCSSCSPGRFSNATYADGCSSCPIGRFNPVQGQSSCAKCPINAVTPTEESISPLVCTCPEGYYGQASAVNPCIPCLNGPGSQCPANSLVPYVNPGYYRGTDVSITYQCIPSVSCLSTGFNYYTTCASGYTGVLCGDCVQGSHYKSGLGCKKCPDPIQKYFGLVVILIFVFIVTYFVMFHQGSHGLPSHVKYAFQGIQLLGLFPSLSSNWPAPLASILAGLSLTNLDIDLFAPGKKAFSKLVGI
jgi:hypothetical protein